MSSTSAEQAVAGARKTVNGWRLAAGVQFALTAAIIALWAWHAGTTEANVATSPGPTSTASALGVAGEGPAFEGILVLGDPGGVSEAAVSAALPTAFWDELSAALDEETERGVSETRAYFRDRRATGSVALMDELLGLYSKYNAVTATDEDWDQLVRQAWQECLYTDEDLNAHLALITERMSRRMSGVVHEAACQVLGLIDEQAPIYATTLSVMDIEFQLLDTLVLESRRYCLEDLKVNLAAEGLSALAIACTDAAIGALLGSAGGPFGAAVGAIVGFAVGLGTALAIEMGEPGTQWEDQCVSSINRTVTTHEQQACAYVSAAGAELKGRYTRWMKAAVQQAIRSRL